LGIERGTLSVGACADIALINPNKEWIVDAGDLQSKSKNTPFIDWKMKGAAVKTLLAGKIVFER
jgi:dihydroorotase